jgi:hypothetical protein
VLAGHATAIQSKHVETVGEREPWIIFPNPDPLVVVAEGDNGSNSSAAASRAYRRNWLALSPICSAPNLMAFVFDKLGSLPIFGSVEKDFLLAAPPAPEGEGTDDEPRLLVFWVEIPQGVAEYLTSLTSASTPQSPDRCVLGGREVQRIQHRKASRGCSLEVVHHVHDQSPAGQEIDSHAPLYAQSISVLARSIYPGSYSIPAFILGQSCCCRQGKNVGTPLAPCPLRFGAGKPQAGKSQSSLTSHTPPAPMGEANRRYRPPVRRKVRAENHPRETRRCRRRRSQTR